MPYTREEIANLSISQIETRCAAIAAELENDTADVDALNNEYDMLIERRTAIVNAAQNRRNLLDRIANDTGIQGRSANPYMIDQRGGSTGETPERMIDTPEYRSAFFHALQRRELTDNERAIIDRANEEQRAFTSANDSAGMTLPTQTQNTVMQRLHQLGGLVNEITLLEIPGNVSITVESSVADASDHTEGAAAGESSDTLAEVVLSGYEVIKVLSISGKVRAMSIPAFESWLVTSITDGIARKVENLIINGTGTNQAKGIEKAQTWTDGKNAVKFAATVPTYAEICKFISLLPGGYDTGAKMLMNKQTLWQKLMPIRDDSKNPLVREDGKGGYLCMGYPIMLSEKVGTLGTIYLGDFKMYIGNFAEGITVKSSEHSSFLSNKIDYRGTAIFDGKPAFGEAFVKAANTL